MLNFPIYLPLVMDLLSDVRTVILNKYSTAASVPVSLKMLTTLSPLRLAGLFPAIRSTKIALVSSMDL